MSLSEHPLFAEFDRRFMTVLGWMAGAAAPVLFAIWWMLDVPVARITGAFAVAVVVYALIQQLTGRHSALLSSLFVMAGFAVISPHYPDLLRGAYLGFSLVFALFAVLLVDRRFAWAIPVAFVLLWTAASLPIGIDGSYAIAMVSIVVILIFGVVAMNRMKDALLGFEARHRALWGGVPVGLVSTTPDGRLLELNQAMTRILRLESAADGLSRPAVSFYADPADRKLVMRELEIEGLLSGRELQIRRADGTDAWSRIHGSRLVDTDGQLVNQFVVEDITEERASREALIELVRLKGRFLASVSHELRTPLTAVVGLARELHGNLDGLTTEEVSEFAATIADQSGELSMLVEDLLVATRLEIGELAINIEDVDLAELADRTIEQYEAMNIAVERRGSAHAQTDPLRVRQIVRNLVSNARRAGAEQIRIDIEAHNGRAFLAVVDNGPGVPAELEKTMFEPYVSAERPSGTDPIGLGLFVSRSSALRMSGELNYQRDNGYSRFVLVLPMAV